MAKSNAERQAEFRSRRKSRETKNLNIEIAAHSEWGLTRLAELHQKTKREVLEEIITRAIVEYTDKHGKNAFFKFIDTVKDDDKTLDLFVTP
jgi:hypothetical protein